MKAGVWPLASACRQMGALTILLPSRHQPDLLCNGHSRSQAKDPSLGSIMYRNGWESVFSANINHLSIVSCRAQCTPRITLSDASNG